MDTPNVVNTAPQHESAKKDEETRLVVELPTEISAGQEPVCRMCCNGPHSPPPR